jgi:hypothetical protein
MNKIRAKILIVLPKVAMKFHFEYTSLFSAYLREYPDRPEKCRGKKVRFTPVNSRIKNEILITLSRTNPVNSLLHRTIPVKIPKTAPKLRT